MITDRVVKQTARTRTGAIRIGLRRGWGDWQRDLTQLVAFAQGNRFDFIDLGPAPTDQLQQVIDAGFGIGSLDLKDWKAMVSADPQRRQAAVEANAAYVREASLLGVNNFLAVVSPEDPPRNRAENFDFAVDAFGQLARAIHPTGARIVIEGAPGPPPFFAALACTPADARAFFAAIAERHGPQAAQSIGINFDPSHLVRMGIDAARFLTEFLPRIHHVHAKDTQLLDEERYQHGNLQSATFAPPHGFGGHAWRYTIPGRGAVPWAQLLEILVKGNYTGGISIELEDEQFNGSEAGEKKGFILARDFLSSV